DVTMIGLDVTHRALFTSAHTARLRGRVGGMVADLLRLDVVLGRGLVETAHRNVEIDIESELCRGRTVVDLWRRAGREPNAHVGVEIDAEGFLELLVERINSLG